MSKETRPLSAGIVDFNPKRMTPEEATAHKIPEELRNHLADWLRYPLNIARHLPEGVSWFSAEQPWFFCLVMSNETRVKQLKQSDILILSGSAMSAYKNQEGDKTAFTAENRERLKKAQELIRNHLGESKWILGICFGGQLAIHAIGGKIGRLPTNEFSNAVTEAGWLDHRLTEAGKEDNVFRYLPTTFSAPHLHNDYVIELPQIGTKIETKSGKITVTKARVLAIRHGYKDKDGLKNKDTAYIHASVIEFNNGARLYQIQPHPEMATPDKVNFLVRMSQWLSSDEEMGEAYYQQALSVPNDADFAIANIIPRFIVEAKKHLEATKGLAFAPEATNPNLNQYLLD